MNVPVSMQDQSAAESLSQRQQAREPVAFERARSKTAALRTTDGEAERLLDLAGKAPRRGKRIKLVLRSASEWSRPLATIAACRRGCAHCCYLPLVISSAEAQVLATASGRQLRTNVSGAVPVRELSTAQGAARAQELASGKTAVGTPCPFLRGGECSVYDARPIACRTHFNLDDDPLLCELAEDRAANVPYADTRLFWARAMSLLADDVLADVRSFFGGGETGI